MSDKSLVIRKASPAAVLSGRKAMFYVPFGTDLSKYTADNTPFNGRLEGTYYSLSEAEYEELRALYKEAKV